MKGLPSFGKSGSSLPHFGGNFSYNTDRSKNPQLWQFIIIIAVGIALALIIPKFLGALGDDPSTIQEYYTVTKACGDKLTDAIASSNKTADACLYSASQMQRLRDGDRAFFFTAIAAGTVLNALVMYWLLKRMKQ